MTFRKGQGQPQAPSWDKSPKIHTLHPLTSWPPLAPLPNSVRSRRMSGLCRQGPPSTECGSRGPVGTYLAYSISSSVKRDVGRVKWDNVSGWPIDLIKFQKGRLCGEALPGGSCVLLLCFTRKKRGQECCDVASKALSDFKTCYKARVIKTVWYWLKDRQLDETEWSILEKKKNKPSHVLVSWLSTKMPRQFNMGKNSLFNKRY